MLQPLLHQACKGRVDLTVGTDAEYFEQAAKDKRLLSAALSPVLENAGTNLGLDKQSQGVSERCFKLSKDSAPLPQVRSLMDRHQTSDAQCGQPNSLPHPRASARRLRRDTIPLGRLSAGWQDWTVEHGSIG